MTVIRLGAIRRYSALSTDPKPVTSVPDGAELYETDTRRTWTFTDQRWWPPSTTVETAAIEALLQEVVRFQRATVLGLSALTGTDLTDTI